MNRFSFHWQNFRSFEDTNWVQVKPLTILIGPNNSGKTSLILPLLIMKQTLNSLDFKLSLLTRGQYTNVGWYEDLIFTHDTDLDLIFHIRFHEHEREKGKLKKIGSYPPGGVSLKFTEGDTKDEIKLNSFFVEDVFRREGYLDRSLRKRDGKYSFDFCAEIPREKKLDKKIWNAITKQKPRHFLFHPSPIFRASLPSPREKAPKTTIRIPSAAGLYIAVCELINSQVRGLLRNISYIGPIREPLKRFYEIPAEEPKSVGIKGEYTPEVMFLERMNNGFMKNVKKVVESI